MCAGLLSSANATGGTMAFCAQARTLWCPFTTANTRTSGRRHTTSRQRAPELQGRKPRRRRRTRGTCAGLRADISQAPSPAWRCQSALGSESAGRCCSRALRAQLCPSGCSGAGTNSCRGHCRDSTCKMISELMPPYVSVRKSLDSASFQTCTGYVSPPWRRQTQLRP